MVAVLRSLRAAARPLLAARPAARAFSVSAARFEGAKPPSMIGSGPVAGQVSTECVSGERAIVVLVMDVVVLWAAPSYLPSS
jgi:hypothetical protein